MFITFEGIDGCGKTTQAQLLNKYLRQNMVATVLTREPGGTKVAEDLRQILLNDNRLELISEALLMLVGRIEHYHKLIGPALEANQVVICDRFNDSTVAYQGYGRGLNLSTLATIKELTVGAIEPDLTFIFDVRPEVASARLKVRNAQQLNNGDANLNNLEIKASKPDTFESLGAAFYQRVCAGYLEIAKQNSGRCVVLDANLEPSIIHQQIIEVTELKLKTAIQNK